MSCLGVHFAITETDASHLLAATGDEAVLEYIQEVIEDRWDEDWLYQSDKAWDAIHRCLCDGSLASDRGTYPLKLAVLGGRQLYSKDGQSKITRLASRLHDRLEFLRPLDADRAYNLR